MCEKSGGRDEGGQRELEFRVKERKDIREEMGEERIQRQ